MTLLQYEERHLKAAQNQVAVPKFQTHAKAQNMLGRCNKIVTACIRSALALRMVKRVKGAASIWMVVSE
eukprot:5701564-Pleurochrysis_carterae.AAC.1